jgi:hypothetical protein
VATFDVKRLDAILVKEVAMAVTQPEDRLKRELELRFTSDLRRLDYAAPFDNTGKLQYGNVAAIPKDLPIDGAAAHRRGAVASKYEYRNRTLCLRRRPPAGRW